MWMRGQLQANMSAECRETVKGFKLDGLTLEEVHLGDVRGGLAQWLPVFTVVQVLKLNDHCSSLP